MFLSENIVLQAYKKGMFPMSDSLNDPYVFWVNPEHRGIIYLNDFKVSKSLRKIIKKENYVIKVNKNFQKVIKLCAKNKFRNSTWINKQIIDSYTSLSRMGKAVSIEYYENNKILGGLYGVILGEIFCGESMFSLKNNASKISIVYLAAFLKQAGFRIIDTQFYSDHLSQFGTIEISQREYLNILEENNYKKDLYFEKKLNKSVLSFFKS